MAPSLATTPFSTMLPTVAGADNDPVVLLAFSGVVERGRWLRSSCRRGLAVSNDLTTLYRAWPLHLPSYSLLALPPIMDAWPKMDDDLLVVDSHRFHSLAVILVVECRRCQSYWWKWWWTTIGLAELNQ
jgi:hypothetical protein